MGLGDGMLLLLARARQDGRQAHEKRCGATFDGPLDLVRSQSQLEASPRKTRQCCSNAKSIASKVAMKFLDAKVAVRHSILKISTKSKNSINNTTQHNTHTLIPGVSLVRTFSNA